ncbi:MAG TPA: hypothetical protein DC048_05210 [Planctomycetaceae bacterium]|nr:hypothetical protein [Planctomycetaceae bacterium]
MTTGYRSLRASGIAGAPCLSCQHQHQLAEHLRRQQHRRLGQPLDEADGDATSFLIPDAFGLGENGRVDGDLFSSSLRTWRNDEHDVLDCRSSRIRSLLA